MNKALAFVFAVAMAGSAVASEEEAVQLKIYVDGMSCPTGCGSKVARTLSGMPGAKDVKLEDFEKGLFTLSVDGKSEIKPDAYQKSLGEFKVKKIEATLSGTISVKEKEIVLTTASGVKYGITVGAASACKEEKAAEGKKDDCDACPVTAALKAKVEGLAKEGKLVKVTGVVGGCCDVSLAVSMIDEVKKATN